MNSFLVKNKRPIIKWSHLPNNVYFEGKIPEGYSIAVSPSGKYIVVDIDKNDKKNGFNYIPHILIEELYSTLNYSTKNNGRHFWFKYTGAYILANKPTKFGIDLRTDKGYVVWYPKEDFRECIVKIKNSSDKMNIWLEGLFAHGCNLEK